MGYYSSMVVLIPAILFAMYAQMKVNSAFNKYSRVPNSRGITGYEAAKAMLDANGLSGLQINQIRASALTNYYDPRNKSLNLSQEVFRDTSIASICVACHEVGHAIQDAEGYAALRIRNAIVPLVNLTSSLSWPLIILGMIMTFTSAYGNLIFNIGVICFVFVVAFHLITLPVELNASNRALSQLQSLGMVNQADYRGSKAVLSAAAMTYVAALATAVANLLRILLMSQNRR